jgi:glycosyltransferase involved in cell wall biosynthesis
MSATAERSRRTRVVHVSWLKRSEGALGGVEKFAMHLAKALTTECFECRIVGWSDHPDAERLNERPLADKAQLLGEWIDRSLEFDIAVADGYWGRGIRSRPVVPVVHGTWAEYDRRMRGTAATAVAGDIRAQHDAFTAQNAFPVAGSHASARELLAHHGRQPVVTVLNGIDLAAFRPMLTLGRKDVAIVLHAAHSLKKGADLLPGIAAALGGAFALEPLAAGPGEEATAYARGDVFLHPSRHEGNAYALLEAMAVGLPIVTTPVGLFESIADRDLGRILPVGAPAHEWAAAIRDVWGDGIAPCLQYARHARQRACELADFDRFSDEWRTFLASLVSGQTVRT